MTNTNQPPRPRTGRIAAASFATAIALTAAVVLAILIANRFAPRFDTTHDRTLTLPPRARATLDQLDTPTRLVLSANLQALDRRARLQLDDALALFASASPNIEVARVDAGAPGAAAAYDALIQDIADQDPEPARRAEQAITESLTSLRVVADALPRLADAAETLATQLDADAPAWLEVAPLQIRTNARNLAAALDAADTAAQSNPLPAPDEAHAQTIQPASDLVRTLSALLTNLAALTDPPPAAASLTSASRNAIDATAAAADLLARTPPPPALQIARLLAASETLLVLGNAGPAAVDFSALFTPTATTPGRPPTLAFTGIDAITTAIATASSPSRTALVLVHAESQRIFNDSGQPTADAAPVLADLIRRVRQRQTSTYEWPVARDVPMPEPADLGLDDDDRVVWLVLGAPSPSAESGIDRATKLAGAITRLAARGQNLLITVNPSELPALGDDDPIAEALEPLGIIADSARVIITQTSTPGGPNFTYSHPLRAAADAEHPIAKALESSTFYAPTPAPLSARPADDLTAAPLLVMNANEDTWAESRWAAVVSGRVTTPPTPDPKRDDIDGPWTIALALERTRAPTDPTTLPNNKQRFVAVAAAQWYDDRINTARIAVEGRTVPAYPANRALLDASITWLAGRDALIVPAADPADVPRIRELSHSQLTAIRWFLIAGLPALTLALGAALRVLRP